MNTRSNYHAVREHVRENPLARSIADPDSIRRHPAREFSRGRFVEADERLAVEEPLEIRLGGRRFKLTKHTPGHDEELVAGFLLAEGFIESRDDLDEIRRVRATKGAPEPKVIDALPPAPGFDAASSLSSWPAPCSPDTTWRWCRTARDHRSCVKQLFE